MEGPGVVHPGVRQPELAQRLGDERVEPGAAGQADQCLVEVDAGGGHGLPVLPGRGGLAVGEGLAEPAQVLGPQRLDLGQRPALHDAPDLVEVGDVLAGELADEDAPAQVVDEQPLADQQLEGLAQRAAGDAEVGAHLLLGEPVARLQLAREHLLAQRVGDPARGPALDRVKSGRPRQRPGQRTCQRLHRHLPSRSPDSRRRASLGPARVASVYRR